MHTYNMLCALCSMVPDSTPKQLQIAFGAFVEWLLPLDIDAAVGFDPPQATRPGAQVGTVVRCI